MSDNASDGNTGKYAPYADAQYWEARSYPSTKISSVLCCLCLHSFYAHTSLLSGLLCCLRRYDDDNQTVQNPRELSSLSHDWYMEYTRDTASTLRRIITSCAPASDFPQTLDLGCGDSGLCSGMAADG